jgi:hypothetical protein
MHLLTWNSGDGLLRIIVRFHSTTSSEEDYGDPEFSLMFLMFKHGDGLNQHQSTIDNNQVL